MTKLRIYADSQRIARADEDVANELFVAGCDDGSPGTSGGTFSIDFHREANTLEEAINSAILNVKSAGYEVDRVEIERERCLNRLVV